MYTANKIIVSRSLASRIDYFADIRVKKAEFLKSPLTFVPRRNVIIVWRYDVCYGDVRTNVMTITTVKPNQIIPQFIVRIEAVLTFLARGIA